jgi:hypothetical protein
MNMRLKARVTAVMAKLGTQDTVLRLVLGGLVVSLFGAAYQIHVQAQAQCNAAYAWSPATTSTNTSGPASAPAIDTAFNALGHSYSYFAQGNQVYAIRNVADADGPAGSIKWTWQPPSAAAILSTPTPAVLSSTGEEAVFVTGSDGFVYKINAANGIIDVATDTHRLDPTTGSAVCATDELTATPTVQLYNSSNSAFQSNITASGGSHAAMDDVVYVATYNQCGDHSHNRVIAYWASNLSVKFTFNMQSTTM